MRTSAIDRDAHMHAHQGLGQGAAASGRDPTEQSLAVSGWREGDSLARGALVSFFACWPFPLSPNVLPLPPPRSRDEGLLLPLQAGGLQPAGRIPPHAGRRQLSRRWHREAGVAGAATRVCVDALAQFCAAAGGALRGCGCALGDGKGCVCASPARPRGGGCSARATMAAGAAQLWQSRSDRTRHRHRLPPHPRRGSPRSCCEAPPERMCPPTRLPDLILHARRLRTTRHSGHALLRRPVAWAARCCSRQTGLRRSRPSVRQSRTCAAAC